MGVYIYGPSGRSTVAEGKDLTQVKYIVGTGGALTRLPHREEIMREITHCNESGMLLLPGEHAQILVDHDYIMASLGVLSKRYPQAAARLLEQSLGMTFPERKAEEPVPLVALELLKRVLCRDMDFHVLVSSGLLLLGEVFARRLALLVFVLELPRGLVDLAGFGLLLDK